MNFRQMMKATVISEDSKKQKKQIMEVENNFSLLKEENENNFIIFNKDNKSTKNEIEKLKSIGFKLENDLILLQSAISDYNHDNETTRTIVKEMNKNILILKTEKELNSLEKENNSNKIISVEFEFGELKSELLSLKKKSNFITDMNKEKIDIIDNEIMDIKNQQEKNVLLQNKYNIESKKEINEINSIIIQKSFHNEDFDIKNKEDDRKKQLLKDKIDNQKEQRMQEEKDEIFLQLQILQNDKISSTQKIYDLEKKINLFSSLETKVK